MHHLGELEIGVMFWAHGEPAETIREVKAFGVRCGQLGIPGEYSIGGNTGKWLEALRMERFAVVTVVCSYIGEMYTDVPTVFEPSALSRPAHGRNVWRVRNTFPISPPS